MRSLRELWSYRELGRVLISKDLKLRYRRSVLGLAWTMLNPLMTMLILTVVFSHVWRVQVESFPVFVLSALLPWNFFSQSLTGGSLSIIHNESLLKNVRVPRAIFPLSLVGSHFVNLLLALVPLLLVMLWQKVPLTPAILILPYCLIVLATFTAGAALAFSAWTVFLRDLAQIVEVSLTALFYLTPIIYPLSIIPEQYEPFFRWNPLYYVVTPFRAIFHDGIVPPAPLLAASGALAVLSFVTGLAIFRRRENLFLHYLS